MSEVNEFSGHIDTGMSFPEVYKKIHNLVERANKISSDHTGKEIKNNLERTLDTSSDNFNKMLELDKLVEMTGRGGPVPGQSLTNDPEQPRPWEKPPTYANPREALTHISTRILQPQAIKGIIGSLLNGAAVTDVSTAILYTSFTEGDISPDNVLLLMEPVMYLVMSIGEEANIQYNIESDDMDEMDEDDPEEVNEKINEFRGVFEDIKNSKPVKSVDKEKLNIDTNVLPESILAKVKEQGPEIRSMLSRQA